MLQRVAYEGSSCAQENKPEGLMTSGRVGEYGERCTAPDPSLRYLPCELGCRRRSGSE